MLNGPIEAAADSGVDVIVMNTGAAEKAREVGALMYVGQPECDAGHAAGLRAKGDGVTSFLCVNHSVQQPTLAQRCQGLADGLGIETGAAMLDGGADPAEIKNEVLAYPFANPNTDAILTLDETGMAGDIRFGAFGLGAEIVKADGTGSIEKYAGEYRWTNRALLIAKGGRPIMGRLNRSICRNSRRRGMATVDERIREMSTFRKALIRPELGGVCGTIVVFAFFLIFAFDSGMFNSRGIMSWSVVSAQFMIIAVGACLLMIAGEFDLSVGSMIGFCGMMIAIFSVTMGWPVWMAIVVTFAMCVAIGALNGYIVIRTGLPGFIVTLAFMFILRGFTIYLPQTVERKTIIGGVKDVAEGDWLAAVFGGRILGGLFAWLGDVGIVATFERGSRIGQPVVDGIPMLIVWAIALIVFGHVLLTRTRFGNWIFASGGDAESARNSGVPVNRVKILMFMFTAFCACVFATAQVMEFGSAGADRGLLKGFEAIVAAVIGGALLTGGYGSVIGAALGALIFGVVQQGLFFAGVESSLFRVFLGILLLTAVVLNACIRRTITGEK